MKYILLLVLFSTACGSALDNYACDPLYGVYQTHWTTLSGDCGDVDDTVVIMTQSSKTSGSSYCHFDDDTISPNQCDETSDYTCTHYDEGIITVWSTYLHSEDEHSNHLKETLTITLYYIGQAEQVCQGTYEVDWSRDN